MPPAWPRGDPRDVVRAIEADPRYTLAPARVPAVKRTWLDLLHDWFVGLLRRVFHGLDHALGANARFETAIGFALLAAACALLAYLTYRFVRSIAYPRRTRSGREPGALGVTGRPTALGLRTAAREAARAGRYREAAGLLFTAAVRALDERGRVTYDAARTPGEYRRIVRDPVFDALAADAVLALFAAAEPRDELFERMDRSYDRFFDAAAG